VSRVLTIREAQLEAMRRGLIARTLAKSHAAQRKALGKKGFRERVEAALDGARALGLEGEDPERRYVSLCLDQGPAFPDDVAWAQAILGWDSPPEDRLEALEARVLQDQLNDFVDPSTPAADEGAA
jgi:hypothetical protein